VIDWFRPGDKNIGIVTGKVSGLVVVDIDSEEGMEAWKRHAPNPEDIQTPTVKTPHGTHLYFRHPGNGYIGNNTRRIEGCDLRADGGYVVAPPSVGPTSGDYVWKIRPDAMDLGTIPNSYMQLVMGGEGSSYSDNYNRLQQPCQKSRRIFDLGQGSRDESLFHLAATLKKGGMAKEHAMQVLEIVADACSPSFPQGEARQKLTSAFDKPLFSERNLTKEITEWVLSTSGHFSSTDLYTSLQLSTRREKKTCSQVLSRLVDGGLIERFGKKNGVFRRREQVTEEIDWLNADVSATFPIKWPFQLERLVQTYPKNIIIVAGASNSGKTAFMLNTIYENMSLHAGNIHYFSSEMSPEELKLRLKKFNLPDAFWNFKAYDRSTNFADAIVPDGLNIIDYLELTDNFFAVGGEIKDIFDQLRNGVAIIAIQKKAGVDLGRGAEFTLEKARLYLAMDPNRLKVIKAKNWAKEGVNPNSKTFKFKLVNGCRFMKSE